MPTTSITLFTVSVISDAVIKTYKCVTFLSTVTTRSFRLYSFEHIAVHRVGYVRQGLFFPRCKTLHFNVICHRSFQVSRPNLSMLVCWSVGPSTLPWLEGQRTSHGYYYHLQPEQTEKPVWQEISLTMTVDCRLLLWPLNSALEDERVGHMIVISDIYCVPTVSLRSLVCFNHCLIYFFFEMIAILQSNQSEMPPSQ